MSNRINCGVYGLLALLVFASLFSLAVNAEGGEYNFGTMQAQKFIAVEPGKSADATLYFFNVHGNRDTHVSLALTNVPQGFSAEIIPAVHNASYNVSGIVVETQENLVAVVTPKELLPKQKPDVIPPGMEYITMGGIEGFVPAQVVTIRLTAPADAPLWTNYKLRVSAVAGWFDVGSTGAISVKQARDFDYDVRVVTKEYSEERVENNGLQFESWMLWVAAIIVLAIVLAAYFLVFAKKRRKASK